MTEREIREVIRELCDELDRGARRALAHGVRKVVLPSMLGAGLALSAGGCGDRATPNQPDQKVSAPDAAYGLPLVDKTVPPPRGAYGVPFDKRVQPRDRQSDFGPVIPPYMAPDGWAPPQPDYMAPFDEGIAPLYAAPAYAVPAPDKG